MSKSNRDKINRPRHILPDAPACMSPISVPDTQGINPFRPPRSRQVRFGEPVDTAVERGAQEHSAKNLEVFSTGSFRNQNLADRAIFGTISGSWRKRISAVQLSPADSGRNRGAVPGGVARPRPDSRLDEAGFGSACPERRRNPRLADGRPGQIRPAPAPAAGAPRAAPEARGSPPDRRRARPARP